MLNGRYAARDTSQGARGQAELHDVVAELSDVARQREARVARQREVRVVVQIDVAALRHHADDLEGQLPCARDCISELAMLTGNNVFWNRITHLRGRSGGARAAAGSSGSRSTRGSRLQIAGTGNV